MLPVSVYIDLAPIAELPPMRYRAIHSPAAFDREGDKFYAGLPNGRTTASRCAPVLAVPTSYRRSALLPSCKAW